MMKFDIGIYVTMDHNSNLYMLNSILVDDSVPLYLSQPLRSITESMVQWSAWFLKTHPSPIVI